MTITTHSDKTICGKLVFQILRDDEHETTTSLKNITCPECISGVEEIIRKLKNKGVTSVKTVATETNNNS